MTARITSSELERIRLCVNPVKPSTRAEQARQARKQRGDARVSTWGNTLDAIRVQKDQARKRREERIEAERQAVDRKEAEIQKQKRMGAIERANMLLYEQTDKMKMLRSAQLFSDVMQDRAYQVQEQKMMQEMEKVRDDRFLAIQNALVAEGDAKEREESRKREEKNQLMAKQQQEQLQEFKQAYIDRLLLEKREGELIKIKVADDMVKQKEEEARRKREAIQAALDTKIANQQLEELRSEQAKEEAKIEAKRKAEAAYKEHQAARTKKQKALRFAEKQRLKQAMIDRATEQLKQLKLANDNREEKQAAEARAAEDAELERRRQRRERQQEAIDRSRAMQLEMRRRRKQR